MGGKQTSALLQCSWQASHDQSQGQHSPWKVFDWYLDNYKMSLLSSVVLCESIDEGKQQCRSENMASK